MHLKGGEVIMRKIYPRLKRSGSVGFAEKYPRYNRGSIGYYRVLLGTIGYFSVLLGPSLFLKTKFNEIQNLESILL